MKLLSQCKNKIHHCANHTQITAQTISVTLLHKLILKIYRYKNDLLKHTNI